MKLIIKALDGAFLKLFNETAPHEKKNTGVIQDIKHFFHELWNPTNYAYGLGATINGKNIKECARYSNEVLRKNGYKNIVGNAWTRAAYSNMKPITNGYKGLVKPKQWDEDEAHEYLQKAANNFANKVDTTKLLNFDVIGLYYPDSPNTKKAFDEGQWNETLTHTGHIVMGNDGTHYVAHNVDGFLKLHKMKDLLGKDPDYHAVSAYRPRK